MSDLQAALGLAQLPKLETFWDRRRAIAKAYDDAFAALPEIVDSRCRRTFAAPITSTSGSICPHVSWLPSSDTATGERLWSASMGMEISVQWSN